MDFLDPAKKRSHNRRLVIGYILVGVSILLTSIILIFLTNGYDVDRKTGEVIQNGLIFADTAPESATIYLNGKDNGQTDKRLTVPAGKYDIEFKRDGYRTWKKTLQLEGSTIERLVYARLFPTKLSQATSATYSGTPTFSTQSLDRRWLVVAQPGSLTDYQIFDTNDPAKDPVELKLPPNILTAATGNQSLELTEWASDNRHVLLQHNYDDKSEFIMLDREDAANAVNINTLLAVTPSKVTLRDKKFDQLYLYDAATKQLSTAETKTKQITPLIKDVNAYKSYGADMVLYSTTDAAKPGKTIVKVWDDNKPYTLHTFNETDTLLDLAQFDGAWYVVVVPVKEGRVYIYKDPFDKIKAKPATEATAFAVMKMTDAAFLSFSANTRFVGVQSGKKFAVYDLETNRRSAYEVPGDVPITQKATWMDGHRYMLDQGGKVVVFDFDGINRQELSTTIGGVLPYFTRDYQRLYTLSPVENDPTKVTLTRSSLKVNLKP